MRIIASLCNHCLFATALSDWQGRRFCLVLLCICMLFMCLWTIKEVPSSDQCLHKVCGWVSRDAVLCSCSGWRG